MPQVSVIIPTHSRPHLLPRAVESALGAGSNVEVIVVDDASSDNTAEVCRTLEGIKYIRLEHNQGVAGARNVGILNSTADYISFLDDDDVRLAQSLDLQAEALARAPEAGLIYGQALVADQSGAAGDEYYPQPCPQGDVFWELMVQNFIPCGSVLFRRSCLFKAGLLDQTEVAALSPALVEQFHQRLPNIKKLSVLPIITDDLRNGDQRERASGAEINIGFAARIEQLKGPMILLEAFAIAGRACPHLRLIIAGAGSLEQKLKASARALGVAARCSFVGVYTRPDERKAFMEGLDIFVLPSLTEGTPNSIVEAMSHGVPVIASAVGGIPDVVTKDSGALVPPGDSAALAEAITLLAEDERLRRRMGQSERERYEKLFSPEAVLPILLSTYRRVAAREAANSTTLIQEFGLHPWARENFGAI